MYCKVVFSPFSRGVSGFPTLEDRRFSSAGTISAHPAGLVISVHAHPDHLEIYHHQPEDLTPGIQYSSVSSWLRGGCGADSSNDTHFGGLVMVSATSSLAFKCEIQR